MEIEVTHHLDEGDGFRFLSASRKSGYVDVKAP